MLTHLQYTDHESMSDNAANIILQAIRDNPDLVICMASGHTPALTCDILVSKIRSQGVDTSKITFIGLDEWVGLPDTNPGSCRYFFEHKLFTPLKLQASQTHLFNGMAQDLDRELEIMDEAITSRCIDLMIVGIGMNGHIGFNEPGTPFNSSCHVADLHPITTSVGQKYFTESTPLSKGITVGLGHLMNVGHLILMASGTSKAEVVQKALEGPIDPIFPASIIQLHDSVTVITDRDASSALGKAS